MKLKMATVSVVVEASVDDQALDVLEILLASLRVKFQGYLEWTLTAAL